MRSSRKLTARRLNDECHSFDTTSHATRIQCLDRSVGGFNLHHVFSDYLQPHCLVQHFCHIIVYWFGLGATFPAAASRLSGGKGFTSAQSSPQAGSAASIPRYSAVVGTNINPRLKLTYDFSTHSKSRFSPSHAACRAYRCR